MTVPVTNLGSCTVDHVYQVPHFVQPGETLPARDYSVFPGGKGLNQSIALARAGASVRHAGCIGTDGHWLRETLEQAGVDTSLLRTVDSPSGHALIQIAPDGENAILIHGGANHQIGIADIDAILADCNRGEFLLLQNEISHLDEVMARADALSLRVIFNAAPMTESVLSLPLGAVDCFIVNETEGEALTGVKGADAIVDAMLDRFPGKRVVLTRGKAGAIYGDRDTRLVQPAFEVKAVDTTGAGDTFTGYFLAAWAAGKPPERCLEEGCKAAARSVTKAGAASSIPVAADIFSD